MKNIEYSHPEKIKEEVIRQALSDQKKEIREWAESEHIYPNQLGDKKNARYKEIKDRCDGYNVALADLIKFLEL